MKEKTKKERKEEGKKERRKEGVKKKPKKLNSFSLASSLALLLARSLAHLRVCAFSMYTS